jgi:ATP-binding cassette, subfamily C, bacterial LapB
LESPKIPKISLEDVFKEAVHIDQILPGKAQKGIPDSGSFSNKEPLLECLVILTKLYGKPFSAESLVAGLPIEDGKSFPELFSLKGAKSGFSRAARKAGFSSKLFKREIEQINPLVLPCILMLKDGGSCIFMAFDTTKTHAKIILPETGEEPQWVSIEDLNDEYLGFAFYLKRELDLEADEETKKFKEKDMHWFWGTLTRSVDIYRDVLIATLLINIFVIATPLFTMNVYDRVVPNDATETLWVLAIGVMIVYIFDTILKLVRTYFLEVAGKKNDIIMSSIIFERVMDFKMSSNPKSVGSFANNLKDFESIRGFLTSATMSAIVDLPFAIIFLFVIMFLAGPLVYAPIATILLILAYTFVIKEPLHRSIVSTHEASAEKSGILIESLSSLETIKSMGAAGQVQWKWEETTGDIANKSIKSKLLSGSITTVTALLIQLNTIALVVGGVYMIKSLELTMGGLIAVVLLAGRAIAPMGQVASLVSNYEHVKAAYEGIEKIMDMPVEHPDGKKFVQRTVFQGSIEFKDVGFTYPNAQKTSLKNISFVINHGEKIGFIGKIGSGKTTIEKLIMGLYAPTEGSMLVDGIDINQLDPMDLRKNIGYVPQDVVLFKGTVKENIIYKFPEAEDKDIITAAEVSGVSDFVNKHPQGFDMEVGERGLGLSGGQRQSITLARALLMNAPILLLDEPTNSMDGKTEAKIIKRLKQFGNDKTIILVTHKPSLLELVDRLILMDDGEIILDGTKEEVLNALKANG